MAVNVNEIIEDFRLADAQAYLDAYQFSDLRYANVFPEQFRPDLSWKSIEAQTGATVAAAVVAFNSRAPRFGRPTPGKVQGDMPKIEGGRDKTESDFNEYRALMNSLQSVNNAIARGNVLQQVIDWRYDDQVFAVNAVRARLEWLSKRIASTGGYELTVVNNEQGVQTTTKVDFGIPASQIVDAATPWDQATADPITDIRNRTKAARAKGRMLRYMFMEQETLDLMAGNEKVQKFAATYVANALGLEAIPSLQTLNIALGQQGLPQIIVWDSYVSLEGKDGSQNTVSGWRQGNIAFTETPSLGNVQYTLSADEYVQAGVAQKTKSGIVLVKTWGIEDPITVITKGTAYATPVLNNSQNVHILRTQPAAPEDDAIAAG